MVGALVAPDAVAGADERPLERLHGVQPLERVTRRQNDEPAEKADAEHAASDNAEDDYPRAAIDGACARARPLQTECAVLVADDGNVRLEGAGERPRERADVRLLEERVSVRLIRLGQRDDLEIDGSGGFGRP